jgi:hypothetical protein
MIANQLHTGYLFMINNGAVPWTSHKQSIVATSTMQAEHMSLSGPAREAIARSHLHGELLHKLAPPLIFSDNQGALDISENPTNHQTKHIDIR